MRNARRILFARKTENWNPIRTGLQRLAERSSEADKKAFFDDSCLIEAALYGDETIISRDDVARCFFSRSAWSIAEIEKIIWINPEEGTHDVLLWLEEAPFEKHRTLKSHRCSKTNHDLPCVAAV